MRKTFLRYAIASVCCLSVTIAGGDDSPVTFWGGVNHRDFGETDVSFVQENTRQTDAQVGFDARMHNGLLAGLTIHHGELDNTFVFDTVVVFEDAQGIERRNEYELKSKLTQETTFLNPYLSWDLSDATVWLVAGYGEGEIKFAQEPVTVGATSFSVAPSIWDVHARTIEAGVSCLLRSQNDAEWRLKSDVQHARMAWKSDNSPVRAPLDIKFDSSRLRLALETRRPDYSMNGIPLEPATQLGIRYYGGNSDGAEMEIESALRYRNATHGLTVEAHAWALDGISEDRKDNQQWGISATLRLARPDWRGLSFSLTSGYGSRAGDIHEFWREDWLARPLDRNPNAWFYARITYGLTPHPVWTTCPRLRAGC